MCLWASWVGRLHYRLNETHKYTGSTGSNFPGLVLDVHWCCLCLKNCLNGHICASFNMPKLLSPIIQLCHTILLSDNSWTHFMAHSAIIASCVWGQTRMALHFEWIHWPRKPCLESSVFAFVPDSLNWWRKVHSRTPTRLSSEWKTYQFHVSHRSSLTFHDLVSSEALTAVHFGSNPKRLSIVSGVSRSIYHIWAWYSICSKASCHKEQISNS